MNTDVSVILWSTNKEAYKQLENIRDFFFNMHHVFTRFDDKSELNSLNRSAGKPFEASGELFDTIAIALEYYHITKGLFNPAVIFALEAVGYDRTFEEIHNTSSTTLVKEKVPALDGIKLNKENSTITMPFNVQLDLSGIAKGWTVQQAAQRLSSSGPCLVNAGGDIMTYGTAPAMTDWSIGITDPYHQENTILKIALNNCGVATSGINKRKWKMNGIPMHHLIDPYTGMPSESDILSVTIIASDTKEAEIFAKTVFLMGSQKGCDFINDHPFLESCIFTQQGKTIYSEGFGNYVQ